VNFRKSYADGPAVTKSLHFSHADIEAGRTVQDVSFPRLGAAGTDWLKYEYQVRWSVRDRPTISVPPNEEQWISSSDAAVALVPPFEKRVVEIDADRALFRDRAVATAVVEFASILANKPRLERKATLRAADAESTTSVSIYSDRGEPIAYRVSWHAPDRTVQGSLQLLDTGYLYLTPPERPAPPPAPAPEPAEAQPAPAAPGGGEQ